MNNYLDEMSEEALEKYIKDNLAGDEDYEKWVKQNKRYQSAKELHSKAECIKKTSNELLKSFEIPGMAPSEAMYVNKMLYEIKKIWSILISLQDVGKKSVDDGLSFKSSLMDSKDITIDRIGEDVYKMVLPIILPNKKHKKFIPDYDNSYRIPIYEALKRTFPGKRPRYDRRVAIVVISCYSKEQPLSDYDNVDVTHLINCLASFFLTDDGPMYYSLHMYGREAEKSSTKVYILPEERLNERLGEISGA